MLERTQSEMKILKPNSPTRKQRGITSGITSLTSEMSQAEDRISEFKHKEENLGQTKQKLKAQERNIQEI